MKTLFFFLEWIYLFSILTSKKVTVFWIQHLSLHIHTLPFSPCGQGWALLGSWELIVCSHLCWLIPAVNGTGPEWKFTAQPLLPGFQGRAISDVKIQHSLPPLSPKQNFQISLSKKPPFNLETGRPSEGLCCPFSTWEGVGFYSQRRQNKVEGSLCH